jgi:hypothetical protein
MDALANSTNLLLSFEHFVQVSSPPRHEMQKKTLIYFAIDWEFAKLNYYLFYVFVINQSSVNVLYAQAFTHY